jgi:hypothetical protein
MTAAPKISGRHRELRLHTSASPSRRRQCLPHRDRDWPAVTARRVSAPRASRPQLGPLQLHPIPSRLVTATEFGRCPVCLNTVKPDLNNRIKTHRNSLGHTCRYGTGLPYTTTHHQKETA